MKLTFKNTRAPEHIAHRQTKQVFSTLTFNTVLNGFFCVPSPVESLPSRSDTYSSSGIHGKYRQLLQKIKENEKASAHTSSNIPKLDGYQQ